jgi:hypothetical protein
MRPTSPKSFYHPRIAGGDEASIFVKIKSVFLNQKMFIKPNRPALAT